MGSKTPITHALSWFILSVIGRHISDFPISWLGGLLGLGPTSPVERPADV